ncbi:MAG: rRNA maturation RNase YbeY [Bacteroidales bacterium]|nr:rRNA maturation RNase YbeY [Bacteroidales bacterium]MCF8389670.1 rRNA maturation RNase YbeY [Bacteroidales bacterium]
MAVWFHSEYPGFQISQKRKLKKWIQKAINDKGFTLGSINYSFLTDEELLDMNKKFLKHNFYTDIISFDYSGGNNISGDIFISVDRIRENYKKYSDSFNKELERVIIHGVLHFLGFKDKTETEKKIMRQTESDYLQILHSTK